MLNLEQIIKENFNSFCFFNVLDDFIHIMTKDFNVVWCNENARNFTKNVLNKKFKKNINLFEWLPFLDENKEKIIEEYKNVLIKNIKIITEEKTIVKNHPVYTKTLKIPIENNNEVELILTIINDRTESQQERERLFTIFDSINEVIYVSDVNSYEILYVNKYLSEEIEKVKGIKREEFYKYKCYEIFQGLNTPCPFCTNDIIINNNGEPYRWPFYNKVFGKHYWLTDKIIDWPDGRKVRFELGFDISDEIEAEEVLKRTIEKIEISNRRLEDFGHIISHDLREPLRTIVNYIEIIKNSNSLPKDQKDIIEKTYDSGKRMQKMIEHLLLLSQLDKDNILEDKNEINMSILIDNVISDLQIKIDETRALVKIKNDLHHINGDENLIRQVFLNLINNSIKYCDKNYPIIEIGSIEKENEIEYSIIDNGLGMPKKEINKYFYSNSVWDNPSSLKGGFGVAICRRIIYLHGGQMQVKSDGVNGIKIDLIFPK